MTRFAPFGAYFMAGMSERPVVNFLVTSDLAVAARFDSWGTAGQALWYIMGQPNNAGATFAMAERVELQIHDGGVVLACYWPNREAPYFFAVPTPDEPRFGVSGGRAWEPDAEGEYPRRMGPDATVRS